jgi:hypothetical protein
MSHAIKNLRRKKMKDVKTRLKAPRKEERNERKFD